MKKKALAMLLVLCMVLSMLPASVFAAQPQAVVKTAPVKLDELPRELPAISTQAKYTVSLSGGSHGTTELLVSSPAASGSEVYFLADPDDGYLAEVYVGGIDPEEVYYIGADTWGFYMPSNKVTIEVKYVAAEGTSHRLKLYSGEGGQAELSRTSAKENESVYLAVLPNDQSGFDPTQYVFANSGLLYYLYMDEETGIHFYELFMPDEHVSVFAEYKKSGPFRVVSFLTSGNQSATVKIEPEKARFLDTVTVTIIPAEGYELTRVQAVSWAGDLVSDLTPIGNNQYTFTMHPADVDLYINMETNSYPLTVKYTSGGTATVSQDMAAYGEPVSVHPIPDEGYKVKSITGVEGGWWHHTVDDSFYMFNMPNHAVEMFVTFAPIYNPVTVTVETGLGGSAAVDVETAKAGDTITLTCAPEEGYRVAQITGADGLVDNGDGTYSFVMPDEPVDLKVLFLRNENPFLDINETQFFYESVLWAYENGITGGVDATHFGPAGVCNRAQVVTFLWSAAGKPAPTITENPFVDIPEKSWYTDAVLWAFEKGITAGSDDTHFNPAGICNRAQVVTFLYKAHGSAEPTLTENPFTDVPDGSWYAAPVLWAFENGITGGTDATHFNPGGQCLRAFAVTFLHKADKIPTVYPVNAQFDETMGTVTLSHTKAAAGEAVTVTAVPFRGCRLKELYCESGADLRPLFGADGYSFYMPDRNETVHAVFEKVVAYNVPPTDPDGQLYVLDLNDMCFHYPDCVEIEQIAPWNYYECTCLRESLIDRDYHPCNTCQS